MGRKVYEEVAGALAAGGVEFAVLKGFSHWPGYALDPRHRPQYDLDLLCPQGQLSAARDAVASLGYKPLSGFDGLPIDHLPAMIRNRGWRWRGDYFDTEMPLGVELHFRLWDYETERIRAPGVESFWERRVERRVEEFRFPALDPIDTVAYAALHTVRHLLRGDIRLFHAYELAHFLESSSRDSAFWTRWRSTHPDSLRALQSLSFRLAREWFGCQVASEVKDEIDRLPEPVRRWFGLFATAPLAPPNKNELWLHLSLLESTADRRAVIARRLFPRRNLVAGNGDQRRFLLGRALHHGRSLVPTATGGFRWWWSGLGLHPQFLSFLAAGSLFNFGMSVFFLLYNLFLLERGFHEDFLGAVASAMGLGSIAGTIPAAFVLRRFGLRGTLIVTFLGVATVCAVRTLAVSPASLIGSAPASGFLLSFYAVSLAPAVAQMTTERSRPLGFSLVFSLGIGIGVCAGVVGGRLPGLLSYRYALLAACVVTALAALPALRLPSLSAAAEERRMYPRTGFMGRFLVALLIWNLATGAFNPFFSAYFAQVLRIPVNEIGIVYSAAQFVQVIAVLAAPLVLRRLGAVTGVMCMQLTTAAALGILALGPPGALAGVVYAGYMAFQYMSEPGMYSLLMDGVEARERGGASALNFLVVFGGQALAAAVAGVGVRKFGYPVVLAIAAMAALLAGFAFRALLGRRRIAG